MGKLPEESQRKNKSLILQTIKKNAPVSRIELSQITNLNKATVSNIVNDFLEKNLIRETGDIISSNGRKATGLSLNMEDFVAITIRIKRNHLRTAVYTMDNSQINFRETNYNNSLNIDSIICQMQDELQLQIDFCRQNRMEILGISIATLGYLYVSTDSYYIKADGFKTLSDADIYKEIQLRFPEYKLLINHDANVSAMAELEYYSRQENYTPASLLNIVGGIGLGGGIIINGRIFQGFHGIAGEVGHLGINCLFPHGGLNGDINYNRSIYEEYASPLAIRNMVAENLYDYPKTALSLDSTLPEIYQAYDNGDPLAEWAMNRAARYLAYGLTGLIFVLDPEVIILGDEIPQSDKFVCVLNKYLADFLPSKLSSDINIRFSRFTEDSVLTGAAITLFDHILQGEDIIDSINHYLSCNH
ncbi:Making large colonies protein [uncultured Roseburia sp.]|uniref:ROK family transcriptional regulator n=1 Tax=Brotonthovivens ammoniilytica TaxID=2981725 RepID=A0ABT2TJE3_9FIRM|nr:ROK family transcriptional regulator [Brotonthovivens ammoniilytica]MCU6762335.1 ROK family transcriptional regulator [Brotonthovivens ammoniilytica]SCI68378.1 Making large colonies protein [uncultured Roseburia sp.]